MREILMALNMMNFDAVYIFWMTTSYSYHIVAFEDGTSIVPQSWIETDSIEGDQQVCLAFPPKKERKFMRKYVNQKLPPGEFWETYSGKVLIGRLCQTNVK